MITIKEEYNNTNSNMVRFKEYFDIYVGLISGKEEIYKNEDIGNFEVLTGENQLNKYIYIDSYPSKNDKINNYLIYHKKELFERKIKKINENNWFQWKETKHINPMFIYFGDDCIYIYKSTQKQKVSFLDKVNYFGNELLMLKPKKSCNLQNVVSYINSDVFKEKFISCGKFKINQSSLYESYIPNEILL